MGCQQIATAILLDAFLIMQPPDIRKLGLGMRHAYFDDILQEMERKGFRVFSRNWEQVLVRRIFGTTLETGEAFLFAPTGNSGLRSESQCLGLGGLQISGGNRNIFFGLATKCYIDTCWFE